MLEQIIVRSEDRSIGSIKPVEGEPFSKQVEYCINQLREFIFPEGDTRYYITQQTFFIDARSRKEYEERSSLIMKKVGDYCGAIFPATSIVAQSPVRGSEVVLELICSKAAKGKEILYKSVGGVNYTVVSYGNFKEVHAAGLMGGPGDSIHDASVKAFKGTMEILDAEGLSINHLIRQWNYIEAIAQLEDPSGSTQNYQIFNDVRARYYGSGSFPEGYPAATGIGMSTGGVIIGFIAVSDSDRVEVKALRNPRQIDAHKYSDGVLVGKQTDIKGERCTPKFERGKMLVVDGLTSMYVSGTASIVGELSLYPGDVEKQTITTIENIFGLFSRENQDELGVDFEVSQIQFSHLRVYVKQKNDFATVKAICQSRLNSKSFLYLESDICRDDLLVEIEGIFALD